MCCDYCPDLCFVLSGLPYDMPGFVVGGNGFPLTAVTSAPVFPPRGPTTGYWPEDGALSPGFSGFGIAAALRRRAVEDHCTVALDFAPAASGRILDTGDVIRGRHAPR